MSLTMTQANALLDYGNFSGECRKMTFVKELVPDEQKAKLDPKVFHSPWTPKQPLRPYQWVIDRERDVFVISLGEDPPWEGGDAPKPKQYLALSWKGNVVKFEAAYQETGRVRDGNAVGHWEVLAAHIPQALDPHRNAVLELIREGLEAMGDFLCNRERLSKVNIHFNLQAQD